VPTVTDSRGRTRILRADLPAIAATLHQPHEIRSPHGSHRRYAIHHCHCAECRAGNTRRMRAFIDSHPTHRRDYLRARRAAAKLARTTAATTTAGPSGQRSSTT
jgi:hypothetical protein